MTVRAKTTLWKGKTMYLETKRMVIRDFLPEDLEDLHAIFGDPETMTYVEPAYTPEKTKEFLLKFCIGRKGALAAVHRESGKVIGYLLFNPCGEPDVYEMGWIFNRGYWRQGYAYESCMALLTYGFGELKLHKVFAEAIDDVRSVGLMKKLGMELEGIQKSQTRDNQGNWADLYFYGIVNHGQSAG